MQQFCFSIPAIIMIIASGCVSSLPKTYRMAKYKPQVSSLPEIQSVTGAVAIVQVNTNSTSVQIATKSKSTGNTSTPSIGSASNTVAKVNNKERSHSKLRTLKSGDNVTIHLRSIPSPLEVNEVIDGWGEVTLPLIGEIKIADKTVSEAERFIESSYIKGDIYKKINVIVVAEAEDFFVRGEVTKRGKYSLSGTVTLQQAISEAGGFTPFANKKKIKVMRGNKILMYNVKDVASGKIPDPLIFSDDIIEVQRRVIW